MLSNLSVGVCLLNEVFCLSILSRSSSSAFLLAVSSASILAFSSSTFLRSISPFATLFVSSVAAVSSALMLLSTSFLFRLKI